MPGGSVAAARTHARTHARVHTPTICSRSRRTCLTLRSHLLLPRPACTALFNPELLGVKGGLGMHESTKSTINKCDLEIRKDLYANVVLCGGSTLVQHSGPGFMAHQ